MSPRLRDLLLLVVVAGAAACGDSTGPEEETDDPCLLGRPIALGESLSGTLSTGDCVASGGAFSDRWSLTVQQEMTIRIDLTSSAFDAFLELRNEAGNVLAQNDDSGFSLDSRIIHLVSPGEYVIIASSFSSGQTGGYRLGVGEAPDCGPVGSLELGQPVMGTLSADDCLVEFGGLQDNWSLTVTAEERFRFELASPDFEQIVLVRDAAGQIITGAGPDGPGRTARVEEVLAPGDYVVSAASPDESARGSYELTVDVAPPCDPGTNLALGDTIQGSLSTSDCLFEGWAVADSFGLELAAETPLRIHLKSSDFQPTVFVRDWRGWDVAIGWDTAFDGNARIRQTVAAGSYSVWVTTFEHQALGDYQLTIDEITCGDPMPIAYGESLEGALDDTDCLRSNGAFQELWALELANDTTVRVDLESKVFDTYLVLMDSAGAVLASNDDGGVGLNSRIEDDLVAGRYVIAASAFSPGATGPYTLSVGPPPASPVSPVSGVGAEERPAKATPLEPTEPSPGDRESPLMRWIRQGRSKTGSR